MDEIYTFSRSGDYVDESKSTCLLRSRLMFGKTVRLFRSESKMGKIKLKNFDSPILTELLVIDGEPIEFECNISRNVRRWRSCR